MARLKGGLQASAHAREVRLNGDTQEAADLHGLIRQATLTRAERRVAAIVLQDYPQSALLTARALASIARVSPPSVSRFTTKLGYASFAELQDHLRQDLRSRLESPRARLRVGKHRRLRPGGILVEAIERDIENLRQTLALASGNVFQSLIERLSSSRGRVYVGGSKKARILAEYLAIQLNQIRGRVTLLRMDDALPDSILDMGPRDALVALEPRRATSTLVRLVGIFQNAHAAVAVISDEYPPQVLARVDYPIPVVIRGVSAFDSYAAYIAVINAIVAALIERSPSNVRARIDRLESLNVAFSTWFEATRP